MVNQYDMVFTADTAGAIASIGRLEAELHRLDATASKASHATAQAGSGLGALTSHAGSASVAVQQVNSHVGSMNGTLMNLANAAQLLGPLLSFFTELGEKITQARQHVKQLTDDFMETRDSFREVASLQGKDGPDDEVVANILKLGVGSGMMPKEANEFMMQFEGSVPAGKQKVNAQGVPNITDTVAVEVAQFGARFGVQQQISPKTAGDFAGVMSQYQQIPDKETAARVMGQVTVGLKAGRGRTEDLMRSLINTAGGVVENGGAVEDLGELGVLLGVASTHANPDAAGTQLRQSIRSLREVNGPQGEWLAENGVKPGMSHVQRLKAIRPAVLAEAQATGEGLDQVIKRHITTNDAEARSMGQAIKDIDLIDARLADKQMITGRDVIASNERFFDPTSQSHGYRRIQKGNKAAQEMLIGHANEKRQMAMENAEQVMRRDSEIGGPENTAWESVNDWFNGSKLGFMSARERKLLARSTSNLIGEARARGMSERDIFVDKLGLDPVQFSPDATAAERAKMTPPQLEQHRAEQKQTNLARYSTQRKWEGESTIKDRYNRLSLAVERQKGNVYGPGPDLLRPIQTMADGQKETIRLLGQIANQKAGPAAPPAARPALPPRGGAAASKRP